MMLEGVELVITYTSQAGTREHKVKASIDSTGTWQQWGVPKEVLTGNVDLLDDITAAVCQHLEGDDYEN